MLKYPNLHHLRFLVAVHEQQGFGLAAKQCHVSQPTLSHGINRLEDILGVELIQRTSKQLRFTEAGLAAVEIAQRMLAESDRLLALSERNPFEGRISAGGIPTLLPAIIGPWLKQIRGRYPLLDLQVTEDTSANLAKALLQGDIDYILAATPYDSFSNDLFHIEELWKDPFLRVMPQDCDTCHDLLLLERTHCLSGHALSACRARQQANQVHFQSSSITGLIEMIANGLGWSYLPETIIAYLRRSGNSLASLSISPLPDEPNRQISAIWRKDAPRTEVYEYLSATALAARPDLNPVH